MLSGENVCCMTRLHYYISDFVIDPMDIFKNARIVHSA